VCRRYERSLRRERCSRRADGDTTEQIARYRERCAVAAKEDALVRNVLAECGLPLAAYVGYANLARHLARLGRTYGSETLRNAVRAAVSEGTARGLNRQAIERLCREVLGVELTQLEAVL